MRWLLTLCVTATVAAGRDAPATIVVGSQGVAVNSADNGLDIDSEKSIAISGSGADPIKHPRIQRPRVSLRMVLVILSIVGAVLAMGRNTQLFARLTGPIAAKPSPSSYGAAGQASELLVSHEDGTFAPPAEMNWSPYACVFGSTILFTLASVVVKADTLPDGAPFPTVILNLFRAATCGGLGALGCWWTGRPLLPRHGWKATATRGCADFIGTFCFYYACGRLPLAVATVLNFTNPFWALPMAKVVLGEQFGMREVSVVGIGLIGVIVTVVPKHLAAADSKPVSLVPVVVVMIGSVMQAVNFVAGSVSVRQEGAHWLHAWVAYGVAALPMGSLLFLIANAAGSPAASLEEADKADAHDVALTILFVACAESAHALLTKSLGGVCAPVAAMIRMLNAPLGAVLAFFVFGEGLTIDSIFGCFLVLGSSLTLVAIKHV
mmetsp:Transcript_35292/g.77273  ORF Transcript_35292/g.77273 Transcript_35292/m.77273 type:complete len:436 (-) Transcript_35292:53-1360(-)|eukprot:CAMPEP_0204272828 /NCGR_PEP_ID=MMETSP0468-20130131/22301_1 /ASSEMBLY_ACC=CAM_ASM_000383 /TAXON_ID=2969 /ORGANISM="Oxyrrhis marina" /LENGTH=435 /DNA_ID=CAMNT_0051248715 /DNA_START=72 /DNA_END=1379 /DNA_ORIENTATION=-